jgi:hypothetical protein
MSDDRILVSGGELGSTLLRAGRDDWPSDVALSRTLNAVGVGVAVVAVTGGAAGAGASAGTAAKGGLALLSFGSVVKWLGVGAVSGVVVAGVAHELTPAAHAPVVTTAAVDNQPPAPARRASERAAPKTEFAPRSPTASEPEPPKPVVAPHAPLQERNEQAEHGVPLAAEVALVDRARAALASGKPARALDELSGYETAFPEPRLEPEVLFLRMEAHLVAGNAPLARETAERSIRLFPRSPHAARARQVIEGRVDEKK